MSARGDLVRVARSLFARGYSFGTAGNLSLRCNEEVFITPTNSSFETVDADDIARLDLAGNVNGANRPSKEWPFHAAIYRARPDAGGVVHLHSHYATALSCLRDLDLADALPPLTPYYAMRVPKLPVVPYYRPGDPRLGGEVSARAAATTAMLLRNHGLIAFGATLAEAAALAEEVEEQARLYFRLGERARLLTAAEIAELRR